MNIKSLQISILSRINFCFFELKKVPPLQWMNGIINVDSIEITKENFFRLDENQQLNFKNQLFAYLDRESTTEARLMLIINYLSALLMKGRNNKISIYKNFGDSERVTEFAENNKNLLEQLKNARDKLYSHVDPDWREYAKVITFDEFERCIKFLNDLLGFDVDMY